MGGGVADTIAAQMERDGVELPKQISNQPVLTNDLLVYLDAFYELDTERSHGMSLVRIPWSSIVNYGDRYGFDITELVFFVRKMDDAHLDNLRSKTANGGSSGTREMVQRPPRPD
jgi:hypothetical protein